MDVVTYSRRPPALVDPVLLAAFEGWNDAGEAASGAVSALCEELGARSFASIDPEEFFDFQLVRPTVSFGEDRRRVVEWPRNRFSWAALPGDAQRHVVLLEGTEPNLRWRAFSQGVVALARELDVGLVVTLGALQVDAPHTRPVRVTGSSSDPELAARLGLQGSSYEGPTGITGVLHQACEAVGLPAVSLWAGIPHYLAGAPYFAGAHRLAQQAAALLGVPVTFDQLAEEATSQRADIEELVAEDEDLSAYVEELEERAPDDLEVTQLPPGGRLATGDELAAAFERYLRDRER